MKDKETKIKENEVAENIAVNDVAQDIVEPTEPVVADGIEAEVVETVAPVQAAPKGKVTMGKRMRDTARRGGRGGGGGDRAKTGGQRSPRGGRGGEGRERIKPEFDSKMIDIRRVSRVVAGGRRYNFSVAVVAGDGKGRVGVGLGKGADTALAIEKATREAKKHLIKVPLSPQMTIPHAIQAKYSSGCVKIFPARGRGVVAGSAARTVIEMAGIKDVCAKIMSGSKNKINIAKATIEALDQLIKVPKAVITGKQAPRSLGDSSSSN